MRVRWWLRRLATRTVPARPLGVFRAAIGLAAVVHGFDLAALLARQDGDFGSGAVVLPGDLWPLPAVLWFAGAGCLLVGYRSRWAALSLAALTAFLFIFADVYSNHLYYLATLAFLLSLTDCGAYASIDARRRSVPDEVPGLAVTLIQLQVSVVYFFSAIGKVNFDFLLGNVLFFRTQDAYVLPDPEPVASVAVFMTLAVGATALELFIAVGLWFARLRPLAFASGLALHAGMIVMLSNTPQRFGRLAIFALLALSSYLLFVRAPAGARVVVSGAVSPYARWVRWFERLDWFGALRFRTDPSVDGLQLVELDGTVHGGFDAVRRVLGVLPVSALWAPYLALRPLRSIGERLYRRAAARATVPPAVTAKAP